MAVEKIVYYEGDGPARSGYALAPMGADVKAPVLVVLPEDGPHFYIEDVPRRAEGGGHTYRDNK